MRVLMTADTLGGVWTYALELSGALAASGVAVTLATMGRLPSPRERREAAEVPGLELEAFACRLEWMPDPWDDVARAARWLLALDGRVRPDLVHLNGFCHAALPWSAPTVVAAHSCVLSWFRQTEGRDAPEGYSRYRREVARGLAAARRIVAPTRAMARWIEELYAPPRSCRSIWNGRRAELFPPLAKSRRIVAAGRLWDKAKNLAALAAVAPALPWPVRLAGEDAGPSGERIELANVERLGVLDGRRLAEELGHAAIYAAPARYEPFGLSVLEAALAGCALVVGDIPTLGELWDGAAIFVPPDDSEALAVALRRLIADDAGRAALARRARARGRMLSVPRMAERYLALYREALAATPSSAASAGGSSPASRRRITSQAGFGVPR